MPDISADIVGQNQPVAGPTDGPSIDFGALRAKALEMAEAADSTPDPAPADPAPVEPETAEPDATETSARKALQIHDDDEVEVIVDGKPQTVSWKDARSKLSGDFKFTQKMQELAAQRQQVEQRAAEINQIAFERDQLLMRLQQVQQEQQAQPQSDPNEIATLGEVQSVIQQQLQAARIETEQAIARANAELAFRQEMAQHSTAINSTLSTILQQNPVLGAIPNAEDLIRYQVAAMQPQTQAEAVEAFNAVAREMVAGIGKHFQSTQKAQRIAEAKQKLVTNSIEPAGGTPPQQQPLNYKNPDGTVNWNAIRNAAASML